MDAALGCTRALDVQASAGTQELFVADLDMTVDSSDESYADRPATTMRVPLPTHVGFSDHRSSGAAEENVQLVRSNEALKVREQAVTAKEQHRCRAEVPLMATCREVAGASAPMASAATKDWACRQSWQQ
jgi:hypothetical protein